MPQNLELGCLWNADDERAYAMTGKLNLSKLDAETRDTMLQALKAGEDIKIVVFENSYRAENSRAPNFNILKARGAGSPPPSPPPAATESFRDTVPF
jgi:hypothetical protein